MTFKKSRRERYKVRDDVVLQRRFELRTPCLKGICIKSRKPLIFLRKLDFWLHKLPHFYRKTAVKSPKIAAESAHISVSQVTPSMHLKTSNWKSKHCVYFLAVIYF